MYLKIDYSYEHLQYFINKENKELYNQIKEANQQDNFTIMIDEKLNCPTPEKLNYFMQTHREWIEKELKLC